MKKICFVTRHAIVNYGSFLQTYATQKLFEDYGYNAEVLDYVREDEEYHNVTELLLKKSKKWNRNIFTRLIYRIVQWPDHYICGRTFEKERAKYLNLSERITNPVADANKIPTADIYCTGSDQVWNSVWNKGIVLPLYLNFVPKDKYKFAYAASFGVDKITDEEIMETKDYINQYNCISVREDSAVDILVNQYCYDNDKVVHLLDPTVAMSREFWSKYKGKSKIKEDYILIYNLNRSKEFDKYAKKLSKKTGLKLVRFCTRYDQFYRPGKSMLVPEVFDFITLISNAKYVLTDSFHATAFSMNMNTEPICVYPNKFGGRLRSFLELTDSLQRHISDYSDFDVLNRKVDFEKVNTILNKERQKTRNFLEKVFGSKSGENNEK